MTFPLAKPSALFPILTLNTPASTTNELLSDQTAKFCTEIGIVTSCAWPALWCPSAVGVCFPAAILTPRSLSGTRRGTDLGSRQSSGRLSGRPSKCPSVLYRLGHSETATCTTSFPATLPLFLTFTVTLNVLLFPLTVAGIRRLELLVVRHPEKLCRVAY